MKKIRRRTAQDWKPFDLHVSSEINMNLRQLQVKLTSTKIPSSCVPNITYMQCLLTRPQIQAMDIQTRSQFDETSSVL
jgi:hypothetical protein